MSTKEILTVADLIRELESQDRQKPVRISVRGSNGRSVQAAFEMDGQVVVQTW
jgi:hypothetical protein